MTATPTPDPNQPPDLPTMLAAVERHRTTSPAWSRRALRLLAAIGADLQLLRFGRPPTNLDRALLDPP